MWVTSENLTLVLNAEMVSIDSMQTEAQFLFLFF